MYFLRSSCRALWELTYAIRSAKNPAWRYLAIKRYNDSSVRRAARRMALISAAVVTLEEGPELQDSRATDGKTSKKGLNVHAIPFVPAEIARAPVDDNDQKAVPYRAPLFKDPSRVTLDEARSVLIQRGVNNAYTRGETDDPFVVPHKSKDQREEQKIRQADYAKKLAAKEDELKSTPRVFIKAINDTFVVRSSDPLSFFPEPDRDVIVSFPNYEHRTGQGANPDPSPKKCPSCGLSAERELGGFFFCFRQKKVGKAKAKKVQLL